MNKGAKHTNDLMWLCVILALLTVLYEVGASIWEPRDRLFQRLSGYSVIFGFLGLIWFYEARSLTKNPYGLVSLICVFLTSLFGFIPIIELLGLPHGASFDSFRWYSFQTIVWPDSFFVGIILGIRAIVRDKAEQKIFGLLSIATAFVLPMVGHEVMRSIIDSKGLTDRW